MKDNEPLSVFEGWYSSLKIVKANNGPAIGTIAATLVLLERLQEDYDLHFDNHIAGGGAQIKGASGAAVAAILKKFDETRPFAKEGGRTNRGSQGDIRPLFKDLAGLGLENLSLTERNKVLASFQAFLVDRVRDFHNRQKNREDLLSHDFCGQCSRERDSGDRERAFLQGLFFRFVLDQQGQ